MKQKGKGTIIILVLIVVIVLIVKNIYEAKSFNNNGVYVIGQIDKIDGAYQGVKIFVSYAYKGKLFKNNFISSDFNKNEMVKKRYFFKIDSTRPEMIRIEYRISVPDTLQEVPYNGWDSLPVKYY